MCENNGKGRDKGMIKLVGVDVDVDVDDLLSFLGDWGGVK